MTWALDVRHFNHGIVVAGRCHEGLTALPVTTKFVRWCIRAIGPYRGGLESFARRKVTI
jgi:hypothetical protein